MTLYYRGKTYTFPRGLNDRQAEQLAEHDEIAKKVWMKMKLLKDKYETKLKVGTWIYCKYCYCNRHPVVNWFDGLIKCGKCDYGLYPLNSEDNIEHFINCKKYDKNMSIHDILWIKLSSENQKEKN